MTVTIDPSKAVKGKLTRFDFEWVPEVRPPPFTEYKAWLTSVMCDVAKRERIRIAYAFLGPNELLTISEEGKPSVTRFRSA